MYLNCHSYHSLRYGTIPLHSLVQQAQLCHVPALALTDVHTVTGIYDFVKACTAAGIKPLVGMEVRATTQLSYVAIATSYLGIGEMCRTLSQRNIHGIALQERAPQYEHVVIIYPLHNAPPALLPHEYIGIKPHELTMLYQPKYKAMLHRMVMLQPVTILSPEQYRLHKVLRAIDGNILLSRLQPSHVCHSGEVMLPMQQLLSMYSQYPIIIHNTEQLVAACNYTFDFASAKNKQYYTESSYSDLQMLTKLAHEGMLRRYGASHKEAAARIKKELAVIDKLHFSAYFLITWDIVRYSNHCGFMHVGRGSGANSIVSYCLGITDICPIELDLYFERFLNEHRKSPPDFDLDWSWRDRDTILDYIFKRFDANHVAFCGTMVQFKYRSIFREVGKAFGLPKDELDALARNPMRHHDNNRVVQAVQHYGMLLEKYPNQRSMHACGVLISQQPITNYTALEMPPKGFPVAQWDMHIAEEIGFEKFDILSQRGLGTIHDAVALIKKNKNETVDIRNVSLSKNHATCNTYLAQGRTIGCFYIESPAMRGLLRRLKCDSYKVLVAASSIIRPGVAQSGMMHEYVFRHNHPTQFAYCHPAFEQHLADTYGVMVYQEDVIKIALHYGGLTAAQGDILRRAISGKSRSAQELQELKQHFLNSCLAQGHNATLSQEVYRQIESFAGYSFCKAHSASYAVESYQSLYLKVHYPIEFMVAAVNNFGGFYRTEIYLHEAKMGGATIHVPCINTSEHHTVLYGADVYIGFVHIQSLDASLAHSIVQERQAHGQYVSLHDFLHRVPIGIEAAQLLIFVGAFGFTGLSKNELVLQARLRLVNYKPDRHTQLLFAPATKHYTLPPLERHPLEDAFDEIDILGFPVSHSPFDLLRTSYRGHVMARQLLACHKQQVKMLAYLVARKQVPTKRGDMYFGTWIDAEGNFFDTAHFANSLAQYPFQGGGCYLLLGSVEVDYHFPTITIIKMAKLPFIADPRYSSNGKQYKHTTTLQEDVSSTHRAPYPQEHEIGLPRFM